jgi:hypothetical protein
MYTDDGYCSYCYSMSQSGTQPAWGIDMVCCRGRHHCVQYKEMFDDAGTLEQPTCKECRAAGLLHPVASVPSSGSAFRTPPSQGPASSQFFSTDSIDSSQRVSYGRAARGVPNPGAAGRQRLANEAALNVADPPLDLSSDSWQDDPALTVRDWELLQGFHKRLDSEKLETCSRCDEKWFRIGLNDDMVCSGCVTDDHGIDEDIPFMYSSANELDLGP